MKNYLSNLDPTTIQVCRTENSQRLEKIGWQNKTLNKDFFFNDSSVYSVYVVARCSDVYTRMGVDIERKNQKKEKIWRGKLAERNAQMKRVLNSSISQ